MSTTNESVRTKLTEAITLAQGGPAWPSGDVEPLAAVAGEAIDALHDIDAMTEEHSPGCKGNGIDADTCVKCRVTQALA